MSTSTNPGQPEPADDNIFTLCNKVFEVMAIDAHGRHDLAEINLRKAAGLITAYADRRADKWVEEALDFTKECQPYNRELRYEAASRAVSKLKGSLGEDYSMTDFGVMVCDELQRLLNE